MRKLLMASAAILGATGGMALAQTPVSNPSQGQYIGPYGAGPAANNNNNNWGVANTPSGSAAAGPLSTLYAPNTLAVPTPGNVVVRLNGRVEADFAGAWATGQTTVVAPTATNPGGSYKVNPLSIGQFMRLYPGFDGMSANGVRYGASIELRQNYVSGTYPGQNNGTTAPGTTGNAASVSGANSGQTVFVRRAFTYIATDQAGIVRLGSGDGVLSLFDPCLFVSTCWDAGSGNLGGGNIQGYGVQSAAILFPFPETQGVDYTSPKIVYLSPQYFGFDLGVQYVPGEQNGLGNSGSGVSCTQAGPQCVDLSSGADPTRFYNEVGVGLRYMHNFGPVDFKAYGYYGAASKENQTAGPVATTTAGRGIKYDNLSYYSGGVAVTALNVTAAVNYIGGAINSQMALRPTGGATLNAFIAGLTYANGPWIAGINFEDIWDQGSATLTNVSQRHQYATSMGGTYRLAPGLQLIAEYAYQYRHQGNFNFATNVAGTGVGATRDAQANTFMFGTVLSW